MPKSSFLDEQLSTKPRLVGDDPSNVFHKGVLHPLCALEKADQTHRAHAIADLTPAEAAAKENEGSGRGLKTDELKNEFLRLGQIFHLRRRRPAMRSVCGVETVHHSGAFSVRQGLRRDVLALGGVQLKAPVVQAFLEDCEEGMRGLPQTIPPSR